ncbi:MAG: ABC transporter ATP-binding protein [Coriobacteriia bacterium]|nr:ABC transporter ATP-binding protein [Coriobacteriia bacterium]
MLVFDKLVVDYRTDSAGQTTMRALDGLSLELATGEAVSIIGPSGCGKSTLLRLAAGLMQPSSGTVSLDGAELKSPRSDTALILQDYGLLPWKSVFANAELGLKIAHVVAPERKARTLEALKKVGLAGFEKRYPAELSGGMQQRLALARALAMDVNLLLMDEPLSALDALMREELQDTLLDLWKSSKHSQILVTHSIEEAVFLGQRIVVMSPRPGRVLGIVDNPEMGARTYRSDDVFFERCKKVRSLLDAGVAQATEQEKGATHE